MKWQEGKMLMSSTVLQLMRVEAFSGVGFALETEGPDNASLTAVVLIFFSVSIQNYNKKNIYFFLKWDQ